MFHEYKDSLPILRNIVPGATRDQMYSICEGMVDPIARAHLEWEKAWVRQRRPFYRVWPKILPMLLKLSLSMIPSSAVQLPQGLDALLIQLPIGNDITHTIIVGHMQTSKGPGVMVGSQDGKMTDGVPLVDMWLFPNDDTPINEAIANLRQVGPILANDSVRDSVLSLVATLCLLDDNPELISPVLLNADAGKTDIIRLAEKARRRGRVGWDIGASIEVAPHFRRPHPALMWTGSGRTIPKVVLRNGSVVHRNKVTNIPEGYLGDERSN